MQSTRRELLRSAATLGGAFAFTRVLAACAGPALDGKTNADADDELVTCAAPVISSNHGHALVVSAADLAARADKTYAIRGTSSHAHSVTITAADFDRLAAAGTLTIVSTRDAGHTHSVTVTCAPSASDGGTGTDGAAADVLALG